MLQGAIRIGQQFRWERLDAAGAAGTAIVRDVRSDRQEGMSPEIEQYVAAWIEAEGQSGPYRHDRFTVLLGTDGKSYLDGQEITVEVT